LELKKLLSKLQQAPLTQSEKNALHRQGLAGIEGRAKLSPEERQAIINANAKALAQKPSRPRER